jgi:outer membrane protein OmpA-like peptidoglycan-associated protein
MKSLKLVKRFLPVVGVITLASGCSTTNDLYAKYDDICEVPKAKTVERVKIVKEVVEKERVVEKKVRVPVEKIKYVDRVKVKEVPKVKIVERIKKVKVPVEKIKYVERIKKVPSIKYVDRVKIKEVPKIKYVDRVKVKTVKQMIPGVVWEPAVYFGFDLASLTPTELARLDRDLLVLRQRPNLKLSVQAFTDSKGSNQYNRNLALRRQQTVVNYLMSKGLAKNRIFTSPLGEELPILGDSEAERVVNRRVELMLLDAAGRPLSLSIQGK